MLNQEQASSPPPLLATKLHGPRIRHDFVPRPHLYKRLDAGLCGRLTLIAAPAGFGKSTLVSEWLATRQQMPPAAWVSLDAGDNDPIRFWSYLITACQSFGATLGQRAFAVLRGGEQPAWETALTLLINDLAQLAGQRILILEDYHQITNPLLHHLVVFLLDHLPTSIHLVMTTRHDPPLPLARLRAGSDLNELRAADLRFSAAETRAFFAHTLASPLASEVIERLEMRSEGWVTALRLVALTLQGRAASDSQALEQLLEALTGSRGHIFAYLIAEVFATLPTPWQEFLLRTSGLDRLSASLCVAVTGCQESGLILEQLAQANLFLSPLDGDGSWYRCHPLFAEAMSQEAQRRLGAEQLRVLAQTASRWYQAHGLLNEAVEAALAAQEMGLVAELVEQVVAPELNRNEYHTLRRWLDQLPTAVLRRHPQLCLTYALAILFTSDRRGPETKAKMMTPLVIAEEQWRAVENWPKTGETLALRAWITWMQGDRPAAFLTARQALDLLPAGEKQWRGISLALVAEEEMLSGKLQVAHDTLSQARALWQQLQNRHGLLATTLALADLCVRQGALQQAAALYRQVLGALEAAPLNHYQSQMRTAGARLGLAELAYEWNDLAGAEQAAAAAVATAQQIGYAEFRVRGTLLLARIAHVRQQHAEAHQLLHDLVATAVSQQGPPPLDEAHLLQARLALAAGDLVAAERFFRLAQQNLRATRLQEEQATLLLARLRIAQGKPAETLALLEPWRTEAHRAGRLRSEIEILLVQSLAHFSGQDLTQARATLTQALALAQSERFQRLFLDETPPAGALTVLLRSLWPVVKEGPLARSVRSLLCNLHPDGTTAATPDAAVLVEPLSGQERRVLHLLAGGLTNAEIADQLIVSVNTVKTQVQSIYGKLNVNSRQAARQAARQLDLV